MGVGNGRREQYECRRLGLASTFFFDRKEGGSGQVFSRLVPASTK